MATEPTRDLAHQFSRAERLLSGRMSALLENEQCTLEEWRVLKILSDGQGHIMTEIADFAMLPAPTLTKLMDRMVSAGLVYRRADDQDRRRVLAYLAERGRDLHERASGLLAAAEAELAVRLGGTGDLSRWLARLTDALAAPLTADCPVGTYGVSKMSHRAWWLRSRDCSPGR
jgi:DNA-binding MarR family transcriptional regulator